MSITRTGGDVSRTSFFILKHRHNAMRLAKHCMLSFSKTDYYKFKTPYIIKMCYSHCILECTEQEFAKIISVCCIKNGIVLNLQTFAQNGFFVLIVAMEMGDLVGKCSIQLSQYYPFFCLGRKNGQKIFKIAQACSTPC